MKIRGKAFGITFLIVYGILGVLSVLAVRISWVETADIWDKFREYLKIALLESVVTKTAFSAAVALAIEGIFSVSRRLKRKT